MMATSNLQMPPTGNKLELAEQIEWDLPFDSESGEFPDFSNLSLGTEMRNKMWESDNKLMLNNGGSCNSPNHSSSLRSSPSLSTLDQNQNPTTQEANNVIPYMNEMHLAFTNLNKVSSQGSIDIASSEAFLSSNGKFLKGNSTNQSLAGTGPNIASLKQHQRNLPLLQSPISMPNERKTPELLSQENGYTIDPRRVSIYLRCFTGDIFLIHTLKSGINVCTCMYIFFCQSSPCTSLIRSCAFIYL